jgi:hypothetical protein
MVHGVGLEGSRASHPAGRGTHHERLLGWWENAIGLEEEDPRRRLPTTVQCGGVVIVHLDGTFTCSLVECPLGELKDPTVVAEKHHVFVSCGYIPRLRCPRCDSGVDVDWRREAAPTSP